MRLLDKRNKKICLTIFILLSFALILLAKITGLFTEINQPESMATEHNSPPSVVIEPGSGVETASYIVFHDDEGWIYAKNGDTGEIEFSGTDADEVINWALNSLTPGRTWKEKVLLKGDFSIDNPIKVPDWCILDMYQADIELANNANCNMIECRDGTNGNIMVEICGGRLDGNYQNNVAGRGIEWDCSGGNKGSVNTRWAIIMYDLFIVDTAEEGIYYDSTGGGGGKYNVQIHDVSVENAKIGFKAVNMYDSWVHDCRFMTRSAGSRDMYLVAPTAVWVDSLYLPYKGAYIQTAKAGSRFSNWRCDNGPTEGLEIAGATRYSTFSDIIVTRFASSGDNTYAGVSVGGTTHHCIFSNFIVTRDNVDPDDPDYGYLYTYGIEEGASCDYNVFNDLILEDYNSGGLRIQGAHSKYDEPIIGSVVPP